MRKSPFVIFILLICLVFSLQAQTSSNQPAQTTQTNLNQPIPVDPNVRIGKLPNGLTYYIRRNDLPANKVEMRLAVNAGSLLERDDQQGLAHFMEHMNFNGTKNFPHNELVAYLQSIGIGFGSDLNAHTNFDETVYILPVPTNRKELVDKGLLVLSDWAGRATLDQSEIDKERGVVLEELRLGLGANQRMRDKYFPEVFAGSEYAKRLPIGKKEIIENFNRQSLLDFYETWYRPDLEAVVIVGDVNVDEMEAKIKAQFSDLKTKRPETKRPDFPVPDTKGTLVKVESDPETTATSVQLLYKKPAFKTETEADLRAQLIRKFYSALLNQRLGEIRQSPSAPFIYAGAGFSSIFRGKDAFTMSGSTSPQNVKATIETLLDENRRVQEFGFTKAELDRLKESYLANLENQYKERGKIRSGAFANSYVNRFLNGDPVTSSEFDYQFGKRVTPTITLTEVNEVAKNTTSDDNRAIIITGPANAAAKYPTEAEVRNLLKKSATAKLAPYTETVTSEPLVKDLPTTAKITDEKKDAQFGITYWTLSNGVKVVLKPTDFQADQISMSGFSPGGMSLEDTEKARSGMYFDSVVGGSGVKNLSGIQLGKLLAGKRANASIGVDELFETVGGYATPQDFETMLQLAYLKFTQINFDEKVFDSVIGKQRAALSSITANPQVYFGEQVFKILTQNNPRAFDPYDTANLDKAKFADIKAIYQARFADASGFTFVFVGNFEPEQIKPQILKYLGSLPSANRNETWKDWGIVPPAGPLDKTINRGVEDKSVVQILYTGKTAYDQNEERTMAALGELLTIKLLESLREEKSGVYGASASGRMIKIPSQRYAFTIQFACAPKNVESLVAATNAEIVRVQNGEIDEAEINKVREARYVKIEELFKNNGYWMGAISSSLMQGKQLQTQAEITARTKAISKEDLQKAAQKYLMPENRLQFVLKPEVSAPAAQQTLRK